MTQRLPPGVPNNLYNRGAMDMLAMIANKEGWEESEVHYRDLFFKPYSNLGGKQK